MNPARREDREPCVEYRSGLRNADIASIWQVVQDEVLYLPIHHQVLNWGMKNGVTIEVDPEDPEVQVLLDGRLIRVSCLNVPA